MVLSQADTVKGIRLQPLSIGGFKDKSRNQKTSGTLLVLLAWRRSFFDPGREAGVSSDNQESLPIWGKHECLEVDNYGVGDSGAGEIRLSLSGRIIQSFLWMQLHTHGTRQPVLGHPSTRRRHARPFLSFQLEPNKAIKLPTSKESDSESVRILCPRNCWWGSEGVGVLESVPVHMWAGGRNTHQSHQRNTHTAHSDLHPAGI